MTTRSEGLPIDFAAIKEVGMGKWHKRFPNLAEISKQNVERVVDFVHRRTSGLLKFSRYEWSTQLPHKFNVSDPETAPMLILYPPYQSLDKGQGHRFILEDPIYAFSTASMSEDDLLPLMYTYNLRTAMAHYPYLDIPEKARRAYEAVIGKPFCFLGYVRHNLRPVTPNYSKTFSDPSKVPLWMNHIVASATFLLKQASGTDVFIPFIIPAACFLPLESDDGLIELE